MRILGSLASNPATPCPPGSHSTMSSYPVIFIMRIYTPQACSEDKTSWTIQFVSKYHAFCYCHQGQSTPWVMKYKQPNTSRSEYFSLLTASENEEVDIMSCFAPWPQSLNALGMFGKTFYLHITKCTIFDQLRGTVGKGACCRVCWLEFYSWDPHGERKDRETQILPHTSCGMYPPLNR